MRLAHLLGRLHRGAAVAALGVVLAALAMSLSQCQMVEDRLTGISIDKAKPNQCVNKCVVTANDAVRVESTLHVDNVQACASDSVCLALEGIRHDAEMDRIQAARDACLSECHHQGSGGGGR